MRTCSIKTENSLVSSLWWFKQLFQCGKCFSPYSCTNAGSKSNSNFCYIFIISYPHKMENGMAIHSSILAWRIPWTEGPGRLWYMGRKESDTTEWIALCYTTLTRTHRSYVSPKEALAVGRKFLVYRTVTFDIASLSVRQKQLTCIVMHSLLLREKLDEGILIIHI